MIYLSDSFSFRTFLVMRNFGRCRPSSAWRQFSEYNLQHGGGVLITEGGRPLPPCLTGGVLNREGSKNLKLARVDFF